MKKLRFLLLSIVRAAASLALLLASPARAQVEQQGPEFQINTYTTNAQRVPSVAKLGSSGDFVVVWRSYGLGNRVISGYNIQGQLFNSSATPIGAQFQINSYTMIYQAKPSLAADANGNFVVVWHGNGSSGSDTSGYSIQGRLFNPSATPLGAQFQVNAYTSDHQFLPSVAMDTNGNFVVAWYSNGSSGSDTSSYSVQGQRFNASATPLGAQFQVNSYTTSIQKSPSVAMDAGGGFVVAWESVGSSGTDASGNSVQGQRFDASATPLGAEFQINTFTPYGQQKPSVATEPGGGFVVAWDSLGSGGTDAASVSIQGQRFDSNATPLGTEFQVNSYTTGGQRYPSVAADADGNFAVAWQSEGSSGTDASSYSVQGQLFNPSATPLGTEFQINTYTSAQQSIPSVALDADGNFVVAWDSFGSGGTDASSASIQGQLFGAPPTDTPTPTPTNLPTETPTSTPPATPAPTDTPTPTPTNLPTETPTPAPTNTPSLSNAGRIALGLGLLASAVALAPRRSRAARRR